MRYLAMGTNTSYLSKDLFPHEKKKNMLEILVDDYSSPMTLCEGYQM